MQRKFLTIDDILKATAPSHNRRGRRGPGPESKVQASILGFLKMKNITCWRQNTGAVKKEDGRFIRFGIPGAADITGLLPNGRRIEIECKAEKGKQSPEQQVFQKMIQNAGGVYILARSVEDVIAGCKNAGYWL